MAESQPASICPPKGDRVAGKVALVSGAGSSAAGIGNGRASAILLAMQGARVGLLDFDLDAANETGRIIAEAGGECFTIAGDVSNDADCAAAVTETLRRYGRLDILVNVVGTSKVRGDATEVDLDEWDRGMRINVKSIVMMARHSVPVMRKRGGGSIINIGSITGLHGGHPNLLYATSKGALVNMTRTMAGNHGKHGVRVNNVAPGFVYTPVVYGKGIPDDVRDYRRRISALQTEGTGWDVGYAVLFLASDEARWITGVTLPIDAGVSAISPHFQTTTPNRKFD
ncbi:SDR family NAD(P)-dependent oxidoreductase [Novosphingobium album (ex Liu et al. 2023)]|uniref:SDR family oxidoreductase n=1 Tax=Novosphingobium album (ex Liu et al. 2023) TaxID=3031130 RepID=A0ABT5WQW6_9SPHN|nr:SDR family oxidoreductase [Novosphingobium album (ex Liu et al. 2023)]MDE8652433.1 SDR family oxidoreductase [Novosphingobium album (ex Liu et al. 2023)]